MTEPEQELVERQMRPASVMTPEQADEWAPQQDLSGGMAADEREGGYNESPTFESSDPRPWAPGEPMGTQLIEREVIERGASEGADTGAPLVNDGDEGDNDGLSSTPE